MAPRERDLIPITVIGGYLGAGKTTLLNRVLRDPGGRRIGVIVNDFGSIGIDAELLAAASDTGVINLPNGCVCCTLGGDLFETLATLRDLDAPPDQIVIEASGVADPAAAAAWGTSAGFQPGGVVVLAAADAIHVQGRDKYVGGEVRRQLAGADLVVVSKTDLCTGDGVDRAMTVIREHAPDSTIVDCDVPVDAILGIRGMARRSPTGYGHDGDGRYARWSWSGGQIVAPDRDGLAGSLRGVLRLKGVLDVGSHHVEIHVVGGRTTFLDRAGLAPGSRAEAVLFAANGDAGALDSDGLDPDALTAVFAALVRATT